MKIQYRLSCMDVDIPDNLDILYIVTLAQFWEISYYKSSQTKPSPVR